MKVVIPMAGRGTRLRPHTLNVPKPLLKLCGKTMIEWIVEEIKHSATETIDEIHFVIGDFGEDVEKELIATAERIGSKGFIHYQNEALGTAHAIYCAESALDGGVFVVFADTIFKGKIAIDNSVDGMIWTMSVDNPESYGVVSTDKDNIITGFIEKPKEFVSKNAIVGLYYFKEASDLRAELKYLIENNLRENNEFQLTNVLETLKTKGNQLKCAELTEWLDCGNKDELLRTNKRLIEISGKNKTYLADDVVSEKSDVSTFNYIESNVKIINSTIENSIVYSGSTIENCTIKNSIIGHNVSVKGLSGKVFLGDFTSIENE